MTNEVTLKEFREELTRAFEGIAGRRDWFAEPFDSMVAGLKLAPDDSLSIDEQWSLFGTMAREIPFSVDDELLQMFVHVLVGPDPVEEEFQEKYEFIEAFEGGDFPEGFEALLRSADDCHTLTFSEDARELALWSNEWGWALVYPDRILRFRTPLDLLAHLETS